MICGIKARYTLFANNSKIGAKWRKNDIRQIVYKRRLLCFANRFFAVRCTQDLHWGSGLIDEHKVLFRWKKIVYALKLTANNEQCTATCSSRFRQQYFIRRKNNFVPYSSCLRIVYSGLKELFAMYIVGGIDSTKGIFFKVLYCIRSLKG